MSFEGISILRADLDSLLHINKKEWLDEVEHQNEFFDKIGNRLPREMREEQRKMKERLEKAE
jgi:phosphoenolpyruvate carboxykinase (GTP)